MPTVRCIFVKAVVIGLHPKVALSSQCVCASRALQAVVEGAVRRSGRLGGASEAALAEPLLSYFEHGALAAAQLQRAAPSPPAAIAASPLQRQLARVRLLLGARAAMACSDEASCDGPAEGMGAGREPRHLTLEAAGAGGALYAGRTLFLGSALQALSPAHRRCLRMALPQIFIARHPPLHPRDGGCRRCPPRPSCPS